MCDYSLCGLPNRLARDGEELIVHKFSTGSMGMASPADLASTEPVREVPKRTFWQNFKSFFEPTREPVVVPAICIPPGAHLIVKDVPPEMQRQLRVSAEEGVIFTQISADVNSYRDAIRFENGCQVRLQELREGMRVEVLSLVGVPSVVGDNYPALTQAER